MKVNPIPLVSFLFLTLSSCVEHDFPITTEFECSSFKEVSYLNDIKPVIDAKCAIPLCHNGSNGEEKNWTVLTTLQGKAVNVRDRVTRPPGTPGHMPASGSLSSNQIRLLVCWVEQGASAN